MNRLGREKSPYLLQHKDNPVDWHPWGEEAFARARAEDKPIFLSIGYSTCYWCHVMERDSFETAEAARVLNEHFVSIKVDREERPDIDQIYMDAVVGLTGHGGWPMSVFLTPDRQPFWGGTFFYRAQFIEILEKLAAVWRNERERILTAAHGITAALAERTPTPFTGDAKLSPDLLTRCAERFEETFDDVNGGFGGAPKFPPSMQLRFLLREHHRSKRGESLAIVETTLDAMMRGGIYDHLGGGFSRYATDAAWIVPHFEKMVYDNALLAVVYLEAFQVTKKPEYRIVVEEVLAYLAETASDRAGGFYSAEDAGEVGKEGEFYVFSAAELRAALSAEEYRLAERLFGVSEGGNFEHGANILTVPPGTAWSERETDGARGLRAKLRACRELRPRPHRDDKVLTSWNGLAITAFARAGAVLGEPAYVERAKQAARFVAERLVRGETLLHRYRDGEGAIEGLLDDYVFFIEGLLALHRASGETAWLERAAQLQKRQDELFYDAAAPGYFYSAAGDLLLKKKEILDGATPAANSAACDNLIDLFDLTGDVGYLERAGAVVRTLAPVIERHPQAVPRLMGVVDRFIGPRESFVVAPGADGRGAEILQELRAAFLPRGAVYAAGSGEFPPMTAGKTPLEEKTAVYRCSAAGCAPPIVDFAQLRRSLE